MNAFAVPGGFIGVNYGLLLAAENEAQLAGVLAHEIAHIKLSHIVQMMSRQSEMSSAVLASFFLAILLSQADKEVDNSEAIEALLLGSTAGAQQSMINFTRENEYEADRKALDIMQKSGYPAIGVAEFFSILEGQVGSGELESIEYLRTHPVSANRMGEAYQFNTNMRVSESLKRDYEFFKVYLGFTVQAGQSINSRNTMVKRFQKAMYALENSEYEKANALLQELHQKDAGNMWVTYALIKLAINLESYDKALSEIDSALVFNPGSSVWTGLKVDVLMAKGNYSQALKLTQALLLLNPYEQDVRFKMVSIYEYLGRILEAKATEAEYHFYAGNLMRAKYLYQFVLERTLDANKKKELSDKIRNIEKRNSDKKDSVD